MLNKENRQIHLGACAPIKINASTKTLSLADMMASKPIVLVVDSAVREIDEPRWKDICSRYEILTYDCTSETEFIHRLSPGGPYSRIQAIMRMGWLKAGPYAEHVLFSGEVLKHYPPTLKLITCSGHGYDAADIEKLTAMGIWYCNTPDTCTVPVANTALFLILNAFRYFTFAENCARTGNWLQSRRLGNLSTDPTNKILGIVGMGDIGRSIAVKASAGLSMKIHYHNRTRRETLEEDIPGGAIYHNSLESLLKVADCICLACPYTPTMHHMLSDAQFALAKPEGLRIVNIARGGLIDEAALLRAMKEGKVVGVGLDVHEKEPGVNEELKGDYMTTLLPHIGVCSKESWRGFENIALDNLESYFFGNGVPVGPVNRVL